MPYFLGKLDNYCSVVVYLRRIFYGEDPHRGGCGPMKEKGMFKRFFSQFHTLPHRAALFLQTLWYQLRASRFALSARRWSRDTFRRLRSHMPRKLFRFYREHTGARWLTISVICTLLILLIAPFFTTTVYGPDESIYLVVDNDGPKVVQGAIEENYQAAFLSMTVNEAASEGASQGDVQIILAADQPVTVYHNSNVYHITSKGETVASLLRRLRISHNDNEMIAVDTTGQTPVINISTVLSFRRNVPVPTDYKTERVCNPLRDKGTEETVQQGVPGEIIETYQDTYRLGQIVNTELVGATDDTSITEIIEYGSRVHEVDRTDRLMEDHPFEDGEGGYLLFESGDTMTYSKKMLCNATAYYGGTSTATGHPVGIGVIAVDPKVIPYRTRMFIRTWNGSRTYGIGTAYDCGGAVKGNIIDLWMPSYADCVSWGRRNVDCWILD